ncbi:hypothetical protein M5D96_003286, partial [Drosophila gunungcola]
MAMKWLSGCLASSNSRSSSLSGTHELFRSALGTGPLDTLPLVRVLGLLLGALNRTQKLIGGVLQAHH